MRKLLLAVSALVVASVWAAGPVLANGSDCSESRYYTGKFSYNPLDLRVVLYDYSRTSASIGEAWAGYRERMGVSEHAKLLSVDLLTCTLAGSWFSLLRFTYIDAESLQ